MTINDVWTTLGLVKPLRTVAFSPSGRFVAVSGDFEAIAIYDVHSGEQIHSLTGSSSWVFSLAWSETSPLLASG